MSVRLNGFKETKENQPLPQPTPMKYHPSSFPLIFLKAFPFSSFRSFLPSKKPNGTGRCSLQFIREAPEDQMKPKPKLRLSLVPTQTSKVSPCSELPVSGSRSVKSVKEVMAVPRSTLNSCLDDLLKVDSRKTKQLNEESKEEFCQFFSPNQAQDEFDDDFFENIENAEVNVNIISEVDPNSEIKRVYGDDQRERNQLVGSDSSDDSEEYNDSQKQRKSLPGSLFKGKKIEEGEGTKRSNGANQSKTVQGINLNMKFIRSKLFSKGNGSCQELSSNPSSQGSLTNLDKANCNSAQRGSSTMKAILSSKEKLSFDYGAKEGKASRLTYPATCVSLQSIDEAEEIEETRKRANTVKSPKKSIGRPPLPNRRK